MDKEVAVTGKQQSFMEESNEIYEKVVSIIEEGMKPLEQLYTGVNQRIELLEMQLKEAQAKATAYDLAVQENVAHEFTILQALKGRTDYEGLPVSEINWLQVLRREVEKAKAYDRLMSGGKKTLKDLANFLGMVVAVDANGNVESFAREPRTDLHYGFWYCDENAEDFEDENFIIPKDIVDYIGNWKDSLTLPDGWEESK